MKKTVLVAGAMLMAMTAMAEGYQINTLSAKQLGMGHVGTAMKLGAESMIFNPGGLAFSDKTLELTGSFTGIKAIASCIHDGNTYKTHNGLSTPLAFNASFRIYDNLQAGVSFYTPYGSSINWTNDWPGAVLNQKVDLKTFTVQPTVSWRITPRLSVGAGLMIAWGSVDLNKALVSGSSFDAMAGIMGLPLPALGHTAAASVNLKGTSDVALGANVGVMYEIDSRWIAGASFRTRMGMKVSAGVATVTYANTAAESVLESKLGLVNEKNFSASMPCPWVLNMGVSYKPATSLTLAFDAQLTGWKTYRQLNVNFPSPLEAFDQNIPKAYKNAWAFKMGAQYAMTKRLDLRAGVMLDTTPVNDNHYNPETPGMTKIEPTVGLSFRPLTGLSVDFSLMYIAGLGADGVSCPYEDLLLQRKMEFKADYRVHAFAPSVGVCYAF
ncbi:MAG: outer membrane protein transport protein [Alloprevotella sp.]|nr:outer membrane protein transport protein [Alloprevotella sp.]